MRNIFDDFDNVSLCISDYTRYLLFYHQTASYSNPSNFIKELQSFLTPYELYLNF